jgi:hypothetical protein
MTLAQMTEAAEHIRTMRREAGLTLEGFTICYPPAEPLTDKFIPGVKKIDIDDIIVIGPWIPSPWESTQMTDPGDDFSALEVKKKAMKRYAETYIAKYP